MDDLDRGRSRYLACASIMYDSTSKILRALINNRCKPDLETYIATNKDKINRIKIVPHFKKVVLEENPNIDEWDTSILCWFLLNIVEVREKKQLNDIRAIRNQLVHCSDSYLKEEQYQNILKLIKSVVSYFEHLTDLDLDLSKEIDRFNIIVPDTKTMERTIHDTIRWHRSELKIVQAAISMPLTEVKDETSTTATVKMEGDVKTRKFYGKRLALSMPLTEVKDETSTTATVKMEGDVKTRKFYGNPLEQIIRPELIPSYLLQKGMASKESMALIQLLQSAASEEYSSADFVWFGYDITMYEEKIPTIVAIYNSFPKDLQIQSRFLSFEVIQKEIGDLSTEAKYVADYEQENSLKFTPEETKELQECLNSNTDRLMKEHSNLLIISASKVKSTCYGQPNASLQHKACVVLYVHLKGIIPLMEEPFPIMLDGFPVDVRESMFEEFAKPNDFLETLMMGCKISTCYNTSGSLGGFVELQSGGIGCLTCCHLFKTKDNKKCFPSNKGKVKLHLLNKSVYQPDDREEFNIGNVVRCIDGERYNNEIGVDAALIKIIKRRFPTSGRFPNADSPACGFSVNNPMVFDSGEIIHNWEEIPKTCNIVKYGAATEHTIGLMNQVSFAARGYTCGYKLPFSSQRKLLTKQIEVFSARGQAFAKPGDSGSLVFVVTEEDNQQKIRALGMLVAGTKHSVVVTPIWAVLGILRDKQLIRSSSSLLSFPLPPAEAGETTRPVGNESVIDELKSEVTEIKTKMNTMDCSIKLINEKIEENHASIKGDLAALMKHIIPKAAKGEIAHENNTEGENGLANKRD